MALADIIIKDVISNKLLGIQRRLADFFNPVFDLKNPSRQELQSYKSFALRFLNGIVSLTKIPTDKDVNLEVLQACVICCDVCLLGEAATDSKYFAPKLLYHVLSKYDGVEYLEEKNILTEKLFVLFHCEEIDPIPEAAIKVIHAAYVLLWNSSTDARKLLSKDPKGNIKVLGQVFMQFAVTLKLLCLLPNHTLLVDRLSHVTILSAGVVIKKCVSSPTDISNVCHGILSVFNTVMTRLTWLCKTVQKDEVLYLKHGRTLCQVRCVVIEWLIKMAMYEEAASLIQDLQAFEGEHMKPICEVAARIYSVTVQLDKGVRGGSDTDLLEMTEQLAVNNTIMESMTLDDKLDRWIVHRTYNHLMQQLTTEFLDHYKSHLTLRTVDVMTKTCDIFVLLCSHTIEQVGTEENVTKPNLSWYMIGHEVDTKKKPDYVENLCRLRLSAHYKKLDLFNPVLQRSLDDSHAVCDRVLETATAYKNLLQKDGSLLTDKALQAERYNLGYIGYTVGKSLYVKADYKHAGPLFKLAGHLCDNSSAVKRYSVSLECYINEELWLEAVKVVVDLLKMGSKSMTYAVGMWCKVKRAAILKGEAMFTNLTLSSIAETSGEELTDFSTRDLLMLEYHSWRKMARREFEIEYVLLTKLLEVSTSALQKGEVMVELSANTFLTGQTYQDSSPGEMLNKAIILLDKSKEGDKSALALANYRKYIISLEETLENCFPLKMLDKDSDTEEKKADPENQPKSKPTTDNTTFTYETPFTLETEQSNLPFLIRALDLWESTLKENRKPTTKETESTAGRRTLFDVEMHVETMIACGTRLILMKQPAYAVRVLLVACGHLKKTGDTKQGSKLKIKTAHALMLLGRFDEAEQMINTLDMDEISTEKQLLMAELFLLMGKREDGMAVVHKVLQSQPSGSMTHKTCLVNGTAKRLLSMFLCFPEGHKMNSVNEDMLFFAGEAVKQHFTVLKYESRNEAKNKGQDKWVLMSEFLQSSLHMCQLLRYTGLASKAEFYVQEGIKMSQSQGLPRWSCEFMFEALRSESMQVNRTRSLAAVTSIKSILDPNCGAQTGDKALDTNNEEGSVPNSSHQQADDVTSQSAKTTANSNGSSNSTEKTQSAELDEAQREMSKLVIPECQCYRDNSLSQCDIHMHRLYVKAGIVLSDFLSQYERETDACRILSDLQSRYPHYVNCFDQKAGKTDTKCKKQTELILEHQLKKGNVDPHIKFLSLEAVCLQAESFLNQKQFDKVDELWTTLKTLETKGFWNNVMHSDILMTRMALCQASSFMLSLQSTANASMGTKSANTKNNLISLTDLPDISSRKRVNFAEPFSDKLFEGTTKVLEVDQENVCPVDIPVVAKKKSSATSKSVLTPLKANNFQDPKKVPDKFMGKLMLSSKKQKLNQVLDTPGRKTKLDFLMASDDEEDEIAFPTLKPITPKSVKSDRTRKVRSRKGKGGSVDSDPTDNKAGTDSITSIDTLSLDPAIPSDHLITSSDTVESKSSVTAVKGSRKTSKSDLNVKRTRRKITVDTASESVDKLELGEQPDKSVFDLDCSETSKMTDDSVKGDHSPDDVISFPAPKLVTPAKRQSEQTVNGRSRKGKLNKGPNKLLKYDLNGSPSNCDGNDSMESVIDSDNHSGDTLCDESDPEHKNKSKTKNGILSVQGRSIPIPTSAFKGSRRIKKNDDLESKSILLVKGDIFDFDLTPDKPGKGKINGKPTKGAKKTSKAKVEESLVDDSEIQKPVIPKRKPTKVAKKTTKIKEKELVNDEGEIQKPVTLKENPTKVAKKTTKVKEKDLVKDEKEIQKPVTLKEKPTKVAKKTTKAKVEESVQSKDEKPQVSMAKQTKVDANKTNRSTRNKRNLRSDIETARTIAERANIAAMDPSPLKNRYQDIELFEDEDSLEVSISGLDHLEDLHSPISFTDYNLSIVHIPEDHNLSIVHIPEDHNLSVVHIPEDHNLSSVHIPEDNNLVVPIDDDIDPIEIMRGGARQKTRGKTKTKSEQSGNNVEDGLDSKVADSTNMEVVRSSGPVSMKGLMEKISMDCPVDVASASESPPNDTQSLEEENIIQSLEELCGRIAYFAPYPQYPKMCQVLAAKYVDTNPHRAAFLLSESIAVSFRHYASVIRGKNKSSSSSSDQSTRMSRDAAMSEDRMSGLENFSFDKDEGSLQKMIDVIPPDWCVVQLSVITDLLQCQHFLLTRFVQGKAPVVVEIPAFSTPQGRHVLKRFESVFIRNHEFAAVTDKVVWWKKRTDLDMELQECIENTEKFWLDAWKGVFMPPVCDEKVVLSVRKEIKESLKIEIDCSKLEVILLSKGLLSDTQLKVCIKGLFGSQCKDIDIDAIATIVKKCSVPEITLTSQHHVVLILDKSVQHLPWECIPVLSERSVSRMPCLSHLYYQLSVLCTQESSLYNKGVNPQSTFYIVNPEGDLSHTEEQFKDWFKRESGWKGCCGTQPSKQQFIEAITDKDLLLYMGHGSGTRYFPSNEIEKLQAHACSILMGCSSGKLHVKGQLEPYGTMMSYFLAGCPCVVANLWDVTDKDIDKYTTELLKTWLGAEDGSHLIPFVQKARKACRMKYLVGSAPVVYGLPVYINRKSENKL